MRFKNKTVIIRSCWWDWKTDSQLAKEVLMWYLIWTSISKRVADEITSAGGTAEPFKLDVTDQNETIEAMKNAYDHFGSLDIAFCNAGIREITNSRIIY